MSPEAQEQLSQTVAKLQGPDGFFYGRAGQEDLYYTFFGLLLAAVTGAKINKKKCAAKLKSVDFASLDLVHACAWLRSMMLSHFLGLSRFMKILFPASWLLGLDIDILNDQQWESLPNLPPHAYPQQDFKSPYSQFLFSTLLTDFCVFEPGDGVSDINAYRLSSGLYANLKHHTEYGVNATAAALFLLPPEQCGETAEALATLQEPDGSFKAVASAPEGDLMSTATAVYATHGLWGQTLPYSVKPFLRECFREDGLFAATSHDPDGDLEYTAYGLLLMGVIS